MIIKLMSETSRQKEYNFLIMQAIARFIISAKGSPYREQIEKEFSRLSVKDLGIIKKGKRDHC